MTGKEALEEIKYCRAYINELGCEVPLSKIREYKIILKELDELTKYKRAFEILKEIFDIRFEKDAFGDCWIKIFPTTYDDRHILGEPTKEQYELLEELMK